VDVVVVEELVDVEVLVVLLVTVEVVVVLVSACKRLSTVHLKVDGLKVPNAQWSCLADGDKPPRH